MSEFRLSSYEMMVRRHRIMMREWKQVWDYDRDKFVWVRRDDSC